MSILDLPPRPDGAMPFIGWLVSDRAAPWVHDRETAPNGDRASAALRDLGRAEPFHDRQATSNSLKTTSIAGIHFIKRWESFRARAYLCPANRF